MGVTSNAKPERPSQQTFLDLRATSSAEPVGPEPSRAPDSDVHARANATAPIAPYIGASAEGEDMTDEPGAPSGNDSEPKLAAATEDARYARAWRVWLAALAHDPEAAWAAALTYRSLDVPGREAWISALEIDAPDVGAPAIALYAPLLAVEDDPARRARLEATLMNHGAPAPAHVLRGLRGDAPMASDASTKRRVVVLVHPLYLNFVEVLTCHLDGERGFGDVRHDPIRLAEQAPVEGDVIDGAELEAVPVEPLIEELAHAVVAHRRRHKSLPAPLARFVDLFAPRPESVDRLKLNGP